MISETNSQEDMAILVILTLHVVRYFDELGIVLILFAKDPETILAQLDITHVTQYSRLAVQTNVPVVFADVA